MTFTFTEPQMGYPNIASIISCVTTTLLNGQAFPVGKIVRGTDPSLGGGEFILLPGVASNLVGSIVTYNQSANTVTLAPSSGTYQSTPVAVSMAANTSTSALSWYQIQGAAAVAKTTIKFNPNVAVYISGTAGKITSTLLTGGQIYGARTINAATVASATATVLVEINRPHLQGSKT